MPYSTCVPDWLLAAAGPMPSPHKMEWLLWKERVYAAIESHVSAWTWDNTIYVSPAGDDGNAGTEASPIETPAEAVARLATNQGNSETTRLLFQCGEEYRYRAASGTISYSLNSGDSIGAYGTKGHPPFLNGFNVTYTSGWTLVSGTRYKQTGVATAPEALRRAGLRYRWDAVMQATSAADAGIALATAAGAIGYWFHDSGANELHVDIGVDLNTITIETAAAYGLLSHGVAANGSVLIENLIIDGYTSSSANGAHCVDLIAPASTVSVVRRCSCAYAGNSHIVVRNTTTSGGLVLWDDMEAGFYTGTAAGTVFNDYGTADIGPTLFRRCNAKRGQMPRTNITSSITNFGRGFFGHTNGASNEVQFVLLDDCWIEPSPFACSGSSNFNNAGSALDMGDVANWVNARVIDYRLNRAIMGVTQPSEYTETAIGTAVNYLWINGYFPRYARGSITAEAFLNGNAFGAIVQSVIDVDLIDYTGARFGFFNPTNTTSNLAVIGSIYQIRGGERMANPRYLMFLDRDTTVPTASAGSYNGVNVKVRGSIIQHIETDITPSGTKAAYLATGNVGANLTANSYYGITQYANQAGGYDNGTATVNLNRPIGLLEAIQGDLIGADVNPMEYDFFERRRPALKSRGPVEANPIPTNRVMIPNVIHPVIF